MRMEHQLAHIKEEVNRLPDEGVIFVRNLFFDFTEFYVYVCQHTLSVKKKSAESDYIFGL